MKEGIIEQSWKHCWRRRNCSLWTLSHFTSMFSTVFCSIWSMFKGKKHCGKWIKRSVSSWAFTLFAIIFSTDTKCVKMHVKKGKQFWDYYYFRFYKPGENVRVLFGTPEFIAPEVVNYDEIGFTTDMWSIGVVCYVL